MAGGRSLLSHAASPMRDSSVWQRLADERRAGGRLPLLMPHQWSLVVSLKAEQEVNQQRASPESRRAVSARLSRDMSAEESVESIASLASIVPRSEQGNYGRKPLLTQEEEVEHARAIAEAARTMVETI